MHTRYAVGLLLMTVACGKRDAGSRISIRFHPPAGAVYHYVLEQRTTMSMKSGPLTGMGKQQLAMRMYFTQTVKGPTDGGTEIDVVFDSTTAELPSGSPETMTSALAKLRGLRSTVVFDERAQVVRSTFAQAAGMSPQLANQMGAGIKAMTFTFPEQPVGRGDSWTVTTDLPLSQLPGTDASEAGPAKTTLTVREISIAPADTSVTLDIKTEFPSGPIRLSMGPQSGTMKMSGDLSGRQQFSITRGAVLAASIQGRMSLHITASAIGAMTMVSDMQNTLHLTDSR
jgi:hypothetical protein